MLLILFLQENTPCILSPAASGAEEMIGTVVLWLILFIETAAAILIGVGVVLTLTRLATVLVRRKGEGYERARLTLARFLALALEFNLRRMFWEQRSHRVGPRLASWAP